MLVTGTLRYSAMAGCATAEPPPTQAEIAGRHMADRKSLGFARGTPNNLSARWRRYRS
jgi:hypothetical protein